MDDAVRFPPSLRACLMVVMLVLLALATYGWILGFYFTQPNTFPSIRSARIQETADLVRILTGPMKSIREDPDRVYRPVSSLSFSLDYAIWELEPLGYHLTDLLLITLLSIGLFLLVRRLGGDDWTGLLAAGLLLVNPILLDVLVPISHRQNTLVALFVVWAFWAYLSFRTTRWFSVRYAAGLSVTAGLFLAAMGSKESGVVFLLFVIAYEVIEARGGSCELFREGWIRARAPHVLPLVGTALMYVGFWLWVTGGRAVWGSRGSAFQIEPLFARGIQARLGRFFRESLYVHGKQYLRALTKPSLAPVPDEAKTILRSFLSDYFAVDPSSTVQFASLGLTLLVLLAGVAIWRGRGDQWVPAVELTGLSWKQLEDGLRRVGRGILGLGLLMTAAFPIGMAVVRWSIGRAYRGEGLAGLAAFMQGRETLPDAYYFLTARDYLIGALVLGLSLGAGLWILGRIHRLMGRLRSWLLALRHRPVVRRVLFFSAWVLGAYLFHAFTTTTVSGHGRKRILLSLVGYTGLLALLLRRAPDAAADWLMPSVGPYGAERGQGLVRAGSVVVVLLLVTGIVVSSPLISLDRQFRQPQKMYRLLYTQLEHGLARLPRRSKLVVRGIPQWEGWRGRAPEYPVMAGSLLRLNFPAWLKLRFPGKQFTVRRRRDAGLTEGCPCHVWIEENQIGSHVFIFRAHWQQKKRSDSGGTR